MATYKQLRSFSGGISATSIQRIEDGAIIPNDTNNRDWQDFQAWIKSGNIALPPDPIIIDPRQLEKDQARIDLQTKLLTTDEKVAALIKLAL